MAFHAPEILRGLFVSANDEEKLPRYEFDTDTPLNFMGFPPPPVYVPTTDLHLWKAVLELYGNIQTGDKVLVDYHTTYYDSDLFPDRPPKITVFTAVKKENGNFRQEVRTYFGDHPDSDWQYSLD
jgi:hypothetical protein